MIVLMLVSFAIKHWLCDFILQNNWMAVGKGQKKDWFMPLLAHAITNAMGTMWLLIAFNFERYWYLAIIEIVVHFIVDRIKAVQNRSLDLCRPKYWILLGADQMIHRIWDYIVISIILML